MKTKIALIAAVLAAVLLAQAPLPPRAAAADRKSGSGEKLSKLSGKVGSGEYGTLDKFFDGKAQYSNALPAKPAFGAGQIDRSKLQGEQPPSMKADVPGMNSGGKSAATPSDPGIGRLNCTWWVFGCKSMPDVSYQQVDGALYAEDSDDTSELASDDVNQGGIGDCYFLSSLAAIVKHHPEAISKLIRQNSDGTYSMDFYEKKHFWEFWKGEYTKKTVTVDGKLPMNKDGKPVFARYGDTAANGDRETWVMLMEKAYAKFRGSFREVSGGGYPESSMGQLTGKKSFKIPVGDVTLEMIAGWDKKGYAVTACSRSSPPKKGVVGGHAYFLKSVDAKKGVLELGNPWGYNHATLTEAELRENYRYVAVNPVN